MAEIEDYADTVGPRRKENDRTDGTQPGDPGRAAKLIVETVSKAKLPMRLLLGSDAVTIVRKGLNAQLKEIDAAQAASESTDSQKTIE